MFCRLSTVFFIDSETNETIPLHFRNVVHFFSEKNSLSKTFPVECVRSGAASCNKRREFWRETHTPLWLLIRRITFLTREKTSFAILIGRIIFFTRENHRLLLWLARTNLRTKIYDIAFWWVFLSMYIIKGNYNALKISAWSLIRDLKHQDGRGGRRLTGSEKSHFDSSAHANRLHHPVLPSSSTWSEELSSYFLNIYKRKRRRDEATETKEQLCQ